MKKIALLLIGLMTLTVSQAQFSLGEIAFTTYNADGTDDAFSFVILRDIVSGEMIEFTENGWYAVGGWRPGENTLTVTFTSDYPCGTEFTVIGTAVTDPGGSSAATTTGGGLALSTGGDQIFAYDPADMPDAGDETGFVAAIHMNGAWDADASSTNTSAKPSVFTDGVNSISIAPEVDNAQYNCAISTGLPADIAAGVNNSANWLTDDGTNFTAPAGCPFTCTPPPCSDPDVPSITAFPTTVCEGDDITLTISGSLNDATAWHIYEGSCGGTLVTTTSSSTAIVTPAAPLTVYYIRGEGGCVTPGTCGIFTIAVETVDDASFNYDASTYCSNEADPTPTITGTTGGTFTSSTGLVIDGATGSIDIPASTAGTYTVTYTTSGTCPNASDVEVTISDTNYVLITDEGCEAYYWNATGITYTSSGSYTAVLTNEAGCDSVVQLDLTINDVDNSVTYSGGVLTANASGLTYEWAECVGGDLLSIPGETGQSFTPPANGSYAVFISDGSCTDTSECILIADLNIDQYGVPVTVYPNPSKGIITISGSFTNAVLTIYSANGQVVRTEQLNGANITTNLPEENGVYLLEIQQSDKIIYRNRISRL